MLRPLPWVSVELSVSLSGGSFNVLSLDEEGVLNIWAVVETRSERQGSQTDLGLAPLAKIGLLRAATVRVRDCLPSSDSDFIDGLSTYDFECSPAHANRVLVATDLGCVLHCDLYGGKTSPKMYRSRDDNTQTDAKCLSCSPHRIPFFLVSR
ncbi:cytoplasmic dynein 2 intermediate chain 1-like [Ixodes scapularis]|uniref:cytoplasmic dynein 2 intermediate chain 1-like n=1 Tax=Ixodes scapularis TaxID=6945 RepID=UPI001C38B64D|nr:cytoplasmic dynein 2 intermediate chain 1-like [Ixodes scapularis]